MSKKQHRSSQKADLPDWADEVTPADEVMEKFYAPTGIFRSGPISIPKESSDEANATEDEQRHATADLPIAPVTAINTGNTDSGSAEDSQTLNDSINQPSGLEAVISPFLPEKLTETVRPKLQLKSENASRRTASSTDETPSTASQTQLFETFANRWKRYLYPGQLAVMRALYELTFSQGTTECFTRYSELASATKMSRRNCINVMNSLADRGFVERLEIRNDATGKGIRLRIHLDPIL